MCHGTTVLQGAKPLCPTDPLCSIAGLGPHGATRPQSLDPPDPVAWHRPDPMEPLNLMEPVDPIELLNLMEPLDPIQPLDPIELLDPMVPLDPLKPLEPMEPLDFMVAPPDPVDPGMDLLNPLESLAVIYWSHLA